LDLRLHKNKEMRNNALVVVAILAVQCLSIVLLAHGIFGSSGPVILPTDSTASREFSTNNKNDIGLQNSPNGNPQPAAFSRMVLVIVDALRSDMVFQRPEMEFMHALFNSSLALGFVARAHSPTVTMPRIKALVTGTIPRFVDLFRNLASDNSEYNQDSLVLRMKRANKTLVLHGDDTWLKLFPSSFHPSSDGTTSSFFTPDFVQVDFNVTRHLKEDLDPLGKHVQAKLWDVLFLHYLGLDHIGVPVVNNTAAYIYTLTKITSLRAITQAIS